VGSRGSGGHSVHDEHSGGGGSGHTQEPDEPAVDGLRAVGPQHPVARQAKTQRVNHRSVVVAFLPLMRLLRKYVSFTFQSPSRRRGDKGRQAPSLPHNVCLRDAVITVGGSSELCERSVCVDCHALKPSIDAHPPVSGLSFNTQESFPSSFLNPVRRTGQHGYHPGDPRTALSRDREGRPAVASRGRRQESDAARRGVLRGARRALQLHNWPVRVHAGGGSYRRARRVSRDIEAMSKRRTGYWRKDREGCGQVNRRHSCTGVYECPRCTL